MCLLYIAYVYRIKRDLYAGNRIESLPLVNINELESSEIHDYWHDLEYDWSLLSPVQYKLYEGGYVEGRMQEDFSGAYTQTNLNVRYYELTFESMAQGLLKDLIHRYYRDAKGDLNKVDNRKFDLLYVGSKDGSDLIFASFSKKVVYINYYGKTHVEKIISLIADKYKLEETP